MEHDFSLADLCDDDGVSGICESCGMPCDSKTVDDGIGPYEYWGAKGVHHDYYQASDCCGAEIAEGGGKIIRNGIRTARKETKGEFGARIMPGDRYRFEVWRCWRKDGPNWVFERKFRIGTGSKATKGTHVKWY